MICLYEPNNLTTAEMKRAIIKAGMNPDPFTWTQEQAEQANKILDAAQLAKIKRNLKKQLKKMNLTPSK